MDDQQEIEGKKEWLGYLSDWIPWIALGIGAIVGILLVANFFDIAKRGSSGEVSGELEVGGRKLSLDVCRSRFQSTERAHAESFFGVDLTSSKDPDWKVRIIQDPIAGIVVRLTTPEKPEGMLLDPETCTRYAPQVETSRKVINGVRGLSGKLSLACTLVTGDVSFEERY